MKSFLLLAFVCLFAGSSCSQGKNNKTMIFNELINYKYLNDSKPGYYLQVNSQNCHYEIRVNDIEAGLFFDPYPVYSVRIPLNLRVFQSGTQTLSVKVLPNSTDILSEKASMELRLMRYPDMTDEENDFGGSTVIWEWSLPNIAKQKLPLYAMDTVFEADVPYKIDVLENRAADLSKMEKDLLTEEVLTQFQKRHLQIENNNQDIAELKNGFRPHMIQIYGDDKRIEKAVQGMVNIPPDKILQPIENFNLRLYANGKMATLLSNNDHESAIWWADKETGEAVRWQPLYVFKNKNTGEWHVW